MTYDCLSLIFLVVAFLSFCCCVAVISLSMCHMSNNVTDLVFPVGTTGLMGTGTKGLGRLYLVIYGVILKFKHLFGLECLLLFVIDTSKAAKN